jgi:hypothetical protein
LVRAFPDIVLVPEADENWKLTAPSAATLADCGAFPNAATEMSAPAAESSKMIGTSGHLGLESAVRSNSALQVSGCAAVAAHIAIIKNIARRIMPFAVTFPAPRRNFTARRWLKNHPSLLPSHPPNG